MFGKKSGWLTTAQLLNTAFLNGTNGVEFDGGGGSAVATGDINGDGTTDLLIGGTGVAGNYVIFGKNPLLPKTTVSTTNGSKSATVASAAGLIIGQTVSSANIPAGTTITAISGTTITLSANATATASGTVLAVTDVILNSSFLNGIYGSEFDALTNPGVGPVRHCNGRRQWRRHC